MIVLIDNYDSFSYNLYQVIGTVFSDIRVIRNDEYPISVIESWQPQALVISPGPGKPGQAGICIEAIQYFKDKVPILGVCLGHQAICEAFGAKVTYAKEMMHGKQKWVIQTQSNDLMKGIDKRFPVARYHSLAAQKESIPKELRVIALSEDDEVMAVEHKNYPVYGVQFHPESIMTPQGIKIVKNFIGTIQ